MKQKHQGSVPLLLLFLVCVRCSQEVSEAAQFRELTIPGEDDDSDDVPRSREASPLEKMLIDKRLSLDLRSQSRKQAQDAKIKVQQMGKTPYTFVGQNRALEERDRNMESRKRIKAERAERERKIMAQPMKRKKHLREGERMHQYNGIIPHKDIRTGIFVFEDRAYLFTKNEQRITIQFEFSGFLAWNSSARTSFIPGTKGNIFDFQGENEAILKVNGITGESLSDPIHFIITYRDDKRCAPGPEPWRQSKVKKTWYVLEIKLSLKDIAVSLDGAIVAKWNLNEPVGKEEYPNEEKGLFRKYEDQEMFHIQILSSEWESEQPHVD